MIILPKVNIEVSEVKFFITLNVTLMKKLFILLKVRTLLGKPSFIALLNVLIYSFAYHLRESEFNVVRGFFSILTMSVAHTEEMSKVASVKVWS